MLELNLFLRCFLELDLYLLLEWVGALLSGVGVGFESGLYGRFSGVVLLYDVGVGVESCS